MKRLRGIVLTLLLIAGVTGGGYYVWRQQGSALPDGIAASNGRIEAVEIDIAAKTAGRLQEIAVNEGDFVGTGQVLGRMDTAVLQAQLREATAALDRAMIGIEAARSQVTQREAEKRAAHAVVAQRKAELNAARKRVNRSEDLAPKGAVSVSKLDDDIAAFEAARAALNAAEAQVAAADAVISRAHADVIGAQAAADGARATIERIQAEIDDSTLVSPRDGRVQYRVAQPGEVLSPGGVVLNMVDLTDVYMTFFLPTAAAGRIGLGAEARLVLDAAPQYVVPATISFVADVAQFTPKTVETTAEREKLMFRLKARIDPALLRKHLHQVKTGLPGMAYVRLDRDTEWPAALQVSVPE